MKKNVIFLLALMILLLSTACVSSQTTPPAETAPVEDGYVVYEAFFLDNEEILRLFSDVRGAEAPYEYLTKDFHVTTAYMPEEDMHEFYGTEVTVHIYAYQNGEVQADDGTMTANEGFFCTVNTENAEMQRYIDSLEKSWHITGSYAAKGGAKYTEYLDLTDAEKVDFSVKGRFGGVLSDGSITSSPEEAEQFLSAQVSGGSK